MSAVVAVTVRSEPNRMKASVLVVLVATTESPPPDNGEFVETLPTDTLTVPVGRKGLTEPSGMLGLLRLVVSRYVPE